MLAPYQLFWYVPNSTFHHIPDPFNSAQTGHLIPSSFLFHATLAHPCSELSRRDSDEAQKYHVSLYVVVVVVVFPLYPNVVVVVVLLSLLLLFSCSSVEDFVVVVVVIVTSIFMITVCTLLPRKRLFFRTYI